jgi:hypothetical protein
MALSFTAINQSGNVGPNIAPSSPMYLLVWGDGANSVLTFDLKSPPFNFDLRGAPVISAFIAGTLAGGTVTISSVSTTGTVVTVTFSGNIPSTINGEALSLFVKFNG